MFPLRCTVRHCVSLLSPDRDGLTCQAGHHFDRAREGYFSLLQPQDRKSKNPGDAESAVLARHRWLARGHMAGMIQRLMPWIEQSATDDSTRTLDLGCGEGSFGPAMFSGECDGYCGIDLSRRAIKLAARGWPDATWVLGNADRFLPAADSSVDRVISLFGRRPIVEIVRVLAPSGVCIVAVPGEEDLIELREKVQQRGHRRSRWEMVVDEMAAAGLGVDQHFNWNHQVDLAPDGIADALAMTYRGARHSQHARVESLEAMRVTLAADLMQFRRRDQGDR